MITSMTDVINKLQQLDAQLDGLGLAEFKLFNRAYQVVTRSIQQAIQEDYFTNPEFIEQFIVTFANYYFAAINDVSPPWSKLQEYAANQSAPVFISLMLGANAHITHDLPQVLKQMMPKKDTANLLSDLIKIDQLLMKSGKEIIGLFDEKNRFLNLLKRRLQFMYYRPAMYTILYWRVRAWRSYKMLADDASTLPRITIRSLKTANHLLAISGLLARVLPAPH